MPRLSTQAVAQFSNLAVTAVNDPARALAAVAGLQGYYGRYSAGRMGALQPLTSTVDSCLAQSVTSREAVLASAAALNLAATAL